MTQIKTLKAIAEQLQRPLRTLWNKCVAQEIDEMRSRSGPRCPQCGAQLILRRVSFGRDTGKEFWDCSNVPKCYLSVAAEAIVWPDQSAAGAA